LSPVAPTYTTPAATAEAEVRSESVTVPFLIFWISPFSEAGTNHTLASCKLLQDYNCLSREEGVRNQFVAPSMIL
jgi:hypothetical protein